jgi:hypothetical protein
VEFPIVVGYKISGQDQSEIAYNQDELDDILDMITPGPGSKADLPYSLDSLADLEPGDRPMGAEIEQLAAGKKMRITKRQLRRIIRESMRDEYRRMGNFDPDSREMHASPRESMGDAEELAQEMHSAWDQSGMSPEDWVAEQDGVWVEAVVAEYMDKINMPANTSTTDPAMDVMREEAIRIFLLDME